MEELAEGFADDNPLSGSASYEIFLNNIEEQDKIVERLEGMEGVRKVRYSSTAVAGLTSAGKMGWGHVGRYYLRTAGRGGFPD